MLPDLLLEAGLLPGRAGWQDACACAGPLPCTPGSGPLASRVPILRGLPSHAAARPPPPPFPLLLLQVVVFTASLGKYADPLLDLLDKANVVRWRLFREACYPYEGSYVKVGEGAVREPSSVLLWEGAQHAAWARRSI